MNISSKLLMAFTLLSFNALAKQTLLGIAFSPNQYEKALKARSWVYENYNIPKQWIELIETQSCKINRSRYDFSFCLSEKGEVKSIDFSPNKAKYFWKAFLISRSQDE